MTFSFGAIHVWNRTKSTAEALARELEGLRSQFKNPSITVLCFDAIEHSVRNADVIVTSTFTSTPLITRAMIKRGAHVNGELCLGFEKSTILVGNYRVLSNLPSNANNIWNKNPPFSCWRCSKSLFRAGRGLVQRSPDENLCGFIECFGA